MVAVPSIVQQALAAKLPSLEAALFRPGQVLEALVLGQTSEGLTQIRIGALTLVALLPEIPEPGTVLQLTVKSAGSPPQLAIIAEKPPASLPMVLPPPGQVLLPEAAPAPSTPLPTPGIEQQNQNLAVVRSGVESTAAGLAPTARPAIAPAVVASPTTVQAVPSSPVARPGLANPVQTAATPPLAAPTPNAVPPQPSQSPMQEPTSAPIANATEVETVIVSRAPSAPVAALPPSNAPHSAGPVAPTAIPSVSTPATVPLSASVAPLPLATTALATVPSSIPSPPPAVAQPGAPAAATPSAPAPIQSVAPVPASVPPATPQQALAQMIPMALSNQGSIGTLLQTLSVVAARGIPLPEPVARAATQVLAGRVAADGGRLTAEALKSAIEHSGVLLEAGLAKAMPQAADGKSALLALRSALSTWLGGDPAPIAPARKVPPPIKGAEPRMQMPEMPVLPDAPRDLGRALHAHTESALSRLKLLQLASLPDAAPQRPGGPELRLELPLMFGPELAMLQLQIQRDGRRRERAQQRGWVMRFVLDSAATGEVGAEIALHGRAISVALWAVEAETAQAFERALPELSASLAELGLDPGAIRCRSGAPQGVPISGQLLERVS